jgi:hypothetical protein
LLVNEASITELTMLRLRIFGSLLLYSIYVFPLVLANCTLFTSKLLKVVSIHPSLALVQPLLVVVTLTNYHPARTFPYRIYVTGWRLSFILGLLTLEDGTHTLSRKVGKQIPHDAA